MYFHPVKKSKKNCTDHTLKPTNAKKSHKRKGAFLGRLALLARSLVSWRFGFVLFRYTSVFSMRSYIRGVVSASALSLDPYNDRLLTQVPHSHKMLS